MAIKPMPTPSADLDYTGNANNTNKTKKKKQTTASVVTNTVTSPPQPTPEVPSAPKVTSNYTQPAPKPNTLSQTNSYLSNASSYNPLSLKQNSTTQKSAMDTIYNKTVTYDAVPTPQKQHGSYKAPVQKSYSYTETKPKANQYVNSTVNTNTAPKPQMYTSPETYTDSSSKNYGYDSPKIYASTPPKTNIGEYKTFGGYTNNNPYVTKDRVQDNGQLQKFVPDNSNNSWGVPKTIKDGAQSKSAQSNVFNNNVQNYGINREMAQYTPARTDPAKELYVEYLKRLTENSKGVNREIVQANFLDHREQNPVEKIVEQSSFKGLDISPVVTKDNVYEQTPEKIQTQLNDTGKMVNIEISNLKRERENLLFEVQYGRIDSDDEQLKEVNYDIQYLQHIQKKIELGLKYQYHFANDELNSLSQADIDDIMNSKEKYGKNLPVYEPYADALKAINKGYSSYQNSVGVVKNIGIEYLKKDNIFKIFDKNNPQNNFEFSTELEFNPKGYYEYIITPGENAYKNTEYIQHDLLKAIDGKAVSKATVDKLVDIAKENRKSASKLFDNAGYFLDFADFLIVMDSDKEFNNSEVGVDTYKAGGEFLGSVMGDKLGSMAGAKAGAVIGTVAFGPIGTVIGGVLGAAAGAYLLSSAMEELGSYMGEYIYEYQSANPTQQHYQHYERARKICGTETRQCISSCRQNIQKLQI